MTPSIINNFINILHIILSKTGVIKQHKNTGTSSPKNTFKPATGAARFFIERYENGGSVLREKEGRVLRTYSPAKPL
jgi:hypothetical protein